MSEGTESAPDVQARPASSARRAFVVAAVVLLGVVGGVVGAVCTRPTYRSHGFINIAPKLDAEVMPMFDPYVASQVQLVRSRRVVDMAMQSAEWRKHKRGTSDVEIGKFLASLTVTTAAKAQVVEVSFVDESPTAAKTAVDQVIGYYMKIVDERDNDVVNTTLSALELRKGILTNKLRELRSRESIVTNGLGRQAVDTRYKAALDAMAKLEAEIRNLDVELASSALADEGEAPNSDGVREKRSQRARIVRLRDVIVEETKVLEKQRAEVASIEDDSRVQSEQLEQVKRRLDQINVESGIHGRTTVLAAADRPVTPDSDPRVTFALLGAVAGLTLGAAGASWSQRRPRATPA